MDKKFQSKLYNEYDYLSMVGLKLIHVSKRVPWYPTQHSHTQRHIYANIMYSFIFIDLVLTLSIQFSRGNSLEGQVPEIESTGPRRQMSCSDLNKW